jgi:hypothetical protein
MVLVVAACAHPHQTWVHLSRATCGAFLHCNTCASKLCPGCGKQIFTKGLASMKVRPHISHYSEKRDGIHESCTYTLETHEHSSAKLLLRDKIRQCVPAPGEHSFQISVSVLLCAFNKRHWEYATITLCHGFTCDVETNVSAGGLRRVGDVVVKNAEGGVACTFEVYKTSRTKNARPEPWFEFNADDVLRTLVSDHWPRGELQCVRFQNNNNGCGRVPCGRCAKYWSDRYESEAKENEECTRQTLERAKARQAKLETDQRDKHGHCRDGRGHCFVQECLTTGCGRCVAIPCAICRTQRVAHLHRKYYDVWRVRQLNSKMRYDSVRRHFFRWIFNSRVRSKRFISVIKTIIRLREKEESDRCVRKKFELTWKNHKRKLDDMAPHSKPVPALSDKQSRMAGFLALFQNR